MNDDLLVKYLAGEADEDECLRVEEWRGQNDANAEQYRQFELIWLESEKLASGRAVDEQAAWERFRERLKEKTEVSRQSEAASRQTEAAPRPTETAMGQADEAALQQRRHPTPDRENHGYDRAEPRQDRGLDRERPRLRRIAPARSWLRAAAALVLLLTAGWLVRYLLEQYRPAITELASEEKVLEETLPDGSVVTLNKNSLLSYTREFGEANRPVTLQGEAFFSVAPDKDKPFIITVNDLKVEVTGTSFNVKSREGRTEVIVETGSVTVSRGSRELVLGPGEKAVSSNNETGLIKENEDGLLYKYYRTNKFVCQATPLQELVNALNDAYGVHIVIPEEALRRLPITTVFDNESLDRILEVIGETFDITIHYEEKQIILKRQ